jgi:hypothetical protein
MSRIYSGFKRATIGIISGLIIVLILKYILNYYEIEYLITLFYIISLCGIFLLYKKMKYWSLWYSIGWIVGVLILYQMLDYWELTLFIIIFIVSLGYNIKYKLRRVRKLFLKKI